MSTPTTELLAKRIERLELQNNRYKRVGLLLLIVLAAFAFMGQIAVNPEVRAQKFSLYDARGRNRAMLFSREGQAILVLSDSDGEPRITLAVGADGSPAIGIGDKGDKVRAELSLIKGASRLALYAQDEKPKALLTVTGDGIARLGLMDKSQSPRIVVGASGEEWGVGVFNAKGKLVSGLGEK